MKSKDKIIGIQRRLAELDIAEGNYEAAEIRLRQLQELREQDTQLSSGLAYVYRLLGQVSLLKQNYELAGQYFQQSLQMAEKIGSTIGIAEAKQHMSKLELALGHIDQAKQLAQEAIEVFTKLGMKRQLRETQALLEE